MAAVPSGPSMDSTSHLQTKKKKNCSSKMGEALYWKFTLDFEQTFYIYADIHCAIIT
jgi:hypothetical protein